MKLIKRQLARLRRAWRSWTFNTGLALALAGYFQGNLALVLPIIKQYIPDDKVGGFVMVVGLVVIVLRFKTAKPLEDR